MLSSDNTRFYSCLKQGRFCLSLDATFVAKGEPFPFPKELEVVVSITEVDEKFKRHIGKEWNLEYEIPKFILEPHDTPVPIEIVYETKDTGNVGKMEMRTPTFFRYFYGTDFIGKMYINELGQLCISNTESETLTGSDIVESCRIYSQTI